jgi:plasmid rolling circle replication initiator protein Rep
MLEPKPKKRKNPDLAIIQDPIDPSKPLKPFDKMSENYDIDPKGKVHNWWEEKKQILAIAKGCRDIMERERSAGVLEDDLLFSPKRVSRIYHCSDKLTFVAEGQTQQSRKKLVDADFCRDRFCPQCDKRRARKEFNRNKKIILRWVKNTAEGKAKPAFLLFTVTVPNCRGDDLGATVDQMLNGFKRMMKSSVLGFVKGYFRSLEVTYNKIRDDYHPHIHIVLAIHESYFHHTYLTDNRWLEIWCESVQRDDVQIVDIKRIKGKKGERAPELSGIAGVMETTKYCTDHDDYIAFDKKTGLYSIDSQVLEVLARELKGRQLIARGKAFKEIYQEFGDDLDKDEDVDLVKTDADQDGKEPPFEPNYYHFWNRIAELGYFCRAVTEIKKT